MKNQNVLKVRMFVTIFCVFLLSFLSAQDSVRCMVVEKMHEGQVNQHVRSVVFIEGAKISVRRQLAEKAVTGKLEFLNDSVIRVDSATIPIRDIAEVGWWTNVLDSGSVPVGKIVGGTLMVAGTAGLVQFPFTASSSDFGTGLAGLAIAVLAVPVFVAGVLIYIASDSRHGHFHKKQLNSTHHVRTETVSRVYAEKRKRAHW